MKQPAGSIIQITFVVHDIRQSVEGFSKAMGVGPFFHFEHVPLANPNYRGQPIAPDFSVAIGFSGGMQIELVQQHCKTPSIYKEFLDVHGEGFHHVWRHVEDFDKAIGEYEALGCELAWRVDSVGLGRCVYFDTHHKFGRYIELMEFSPTLRALWDKMEEISDDWDGGGALLRPLPVL